MVATLTQAKTTGEALPRRTRAVQLASSLAFIALMAAGFAAVSVQLVKLALHGQTSGLQLNATRTAVTTYSRPDIVDRNGTLLATDLTAHSLFADPHNILDPDETAEALARIFPDLDARELRNKLADRARRFVWIKRGLSSADAQRAHNLGFPALGFRTEPKRRYPQGRMAGHVLGGVSIDNRGLSGLERHIDQTMGLESGLSGDAGRPPVMLTIDIGVQHSLEDELATAIARYRARSAVGLVMNVVDGEMLAAASLPDIDPAHPSETLQPDRIDRLHIATYELGSVFKLITVAMALQHGLVTPMTKIDTRTGLLTGGHLIRDSHQADRPLTVTEIFTRSSNVGAGKLALMVGIDRQKEFLARLGLSDRLTTEAAILTEPRLPQPWAETELVTVSYGHGLAVAPLQFAAAVASLINGGLPIKPHFLRPAPGTHPANAPQQRVINARTSAMLRDMMRRNVAEPGGTGRSAAVHGYDIGGKTGTAEMAIDGSYREKSVVSSFIAALPMSAPRYLVLVVIIEPKPTAETRGRITASSNAGPTTAAIIRRIGPLLTLPKQ